MVHPPLGCRDGTEPVLREGSHQDRQLQSRDKSTVTGRAGGKGTKPYMRNYKKS